MTHPRYRPRRWAAGWRSVGYERLWLAPRVPSDAEFPEAALKVAQTLVLDTYQREFLRGYWPHGRLAAF